MSVPQMLDGESLLIAEELYRKAFQQPRWPSSPAKHRPRITSVVAVQLAGRIHRGPSSSFAVSSAKRPAVTALHLNPRPSLCQAYSGKCPTRGRFQLCLGNSSRDEYRGCKHNRGRRPPRIRIAKRPLRRTYCQAHARQKTETHELRGSRTCRAERDRASPTAKK